MPLDLRQKTEWNKRKEAFIYNTFKKAGFPYKEELAYLFGYEINRLGNNALSSGKCISIFNRITCGQDWQ